MVVQHFWCRKIREIVCRVPREWVKSKLLWQDADVMSLADKCRVVGCFVCGDYDKILVETGKFSDNIRVTENGLLSGVDRVLKVRRGFAFVTESWVRKFDGQLSECAQITYDVMESVGAKEITSFSVESWGCKTQCLGVFLGESVNLAAP